MESTASSWPFSRSKTAHLLLKFHNYEAEIVQELLKEEKTVSQLASETGIHPTQLKEWKRIALTRLPELLSRNDRALDEARLRE
jgi:putative transposase